MNEPLVQPVLFGPLLVLPRVGAARVREELLHSGQPLQPRHLARQELAVFALHHPFVVDAGVHALAHTSVLPLVGACVGGGRGKAVASAPA